MWCRWEKESARSLAHSKAITLKVITAMATALVIVGAAHRSRAARPGTARRRSSQMLEAKHIEQVCVRARDGEEVTLPHDGAAATRAPCLICLEEVSTLRGLACPEGHLICSACLQRYICSLAGSAKLRSSNGALDCPGAHHQAFCFGRSMVEPLCFGDSLRLYLETMETPETPETPETTGEGEVKWTPESIQAELHEALNLCCPSCEVFCDQNPDGCIAMKCSSCDVAFCWLCFQPCGRDAHPHCREVHGGYFPPRSVVNHWHRRLRWRRVDGVLQRAFGERPAPMLAVVVEKFNGLLSGLKNGFGRLFNFVPSAEGCAAAEAGATAAAKAEAACMASKRKEALREEALRLCVWNLADSEIRLWPFPTTSRPWSRQWDACSKLYRTCSCKRRSLGGSTSFDGSSTTRRS